MTGDEAQEESHEMRQRRRGRGRGRRDEAEETSHDPSRETSHISSHESHLTGVTSPDESHILRGGGAEETSQREGEAARRRTTPVFFTHPHTLSLSHTDRAEGRGGGTEEKSQPKV